MARTLHTLPDNQAQELRNTILEAYKQHGTINGAARELGVCHKTVRRVLKGEDMARKPNQYAKIKTPVFDKKVDDEITIEELLSYRRKVTSRKIAAEKENEILNVAMPDNLPFGIMLFGDPHLDDDGCDITEFESHLKLVRDTEGLYAGNVGDLQNNWIGRLARLYANQSTTAKHAWMLVEWMCDYLKMPDGSNKWLYIVSGNHDNWSGNGDPLHYITRQAGILNEGTDCRLSFNFPNGRKVRMHTRHDFAGHSQWNTNHGLAKRQQTFGRDHIFVCGHKHTSGYTMAKLPLEDRAIISHAVRAAGYKKSDHYPKELGLKDEHITSSPVLIIDPRYDDTTPDMIFYDASPTRAAKFIKFLREEAKAELAAKPTQDKKLKFTGSKP